MSNLGDDELSLIFHWINDSNNRNSFSLVCKRWLRARVKPICLFGSLNPILSKVFYQNSQFYAHLNQRGFSAMPISNLWPKHDIKYRFFMLISNKNVKILMMLVMMVFVLLQMGVQSFLKFH